MPPVTSSAINKSKTVAPKAVARRRPVAPTSAAAAVAHKPKSSPAPSSAPAPPPTPQSQPEQDAVAGASHIDSTPAVRPSVTSAPNYDQPTLPVVSVQAQISSGVDALPPLPTPPATQQTVDAQPDVPVEQPGRVTTHPPITAQAQPSKSPALSQVEVPAGSTSHPTPAHPPQTSRPAQAVSTHPDTVHDVEPQPDAARDTTSLNAASRITSPPSVAGAKRKRNQPVAEKQPSAASEVQPGQDIHASEPSTGDGQPEEESEAATAGAAPIAQMISPERTRKRGLQSAPKPPKPTNAPRAKRQKKSAAQDNAPTDAEGTEAAQIAVEGPNDEGTQEEGTPVIPAIVKKNARARRQPKSAARIIEDEEGNVIDEPQRSPEDVTDHPTTTKQRRPRKPKEPKEPTEPKDPKEKKERRKKKDPREAAAEDEDIEDPEHYEIDPNNVKMSDLTRDRGVGRQSQRETKMAGIDWEEVARKRLEAAEAIRAGTATGLDGAPPRIQENGDEDAEGNPTPRLGGPRMVLDAEGNLVVDQESLQIDRQAQAARDAANMVVTEEDDLTKRVNQMSWISARKRDPTERLPFFKMKSDPWSEEETDRFYEALKMFGTDFFIISKMFPPKTRRQIKLKFIREERLDADRVNRALSGESTVPMSLDHFAEATGQELDNFKDPRLLEEELRVEGEEQREEIARKKKEMDEAKQQRDVQMAARERENAQRSEVRKNKALARRGGRGLVGTGTF